ncbi:Bcr/CflA family drug resistance efflux transporter [Mucilaginibacter hurinus]|uniref:Bcr/CflA family drug resistance efflux transporter n=1 Tax=Mucilaginibacter hurinus TaxID=2201324 RepID=A0A367GU67_9SPHI|nr:multidrug effflux MFS transporter [Mucilaginibacter hurinus]RCH56605.1 Bcr/CflA family drug resistance efflux transporter [Mucilaginibacter hurinus]
MTRQRHFFLILILGSLTALPPFSIDMYLPGFPAIARFLHTDVAGVALSLSAFFIGLAFGQLLYGPLLDKFGRKKPLYIGLLIYIIASVGCASITSLQGLIVLRIIQALGSCAAAVASMAMVRDLFPVSENAKVFALLMLVVGASPMVAPTVGGYVTAGPGWQWVFIILALMGVVILLSVLFFLPDAYVPDKNLSLKPVPIIKGFWEVLKTPQFYTYAFTGAFAFSGLFAYVAGSPLVFMEVYGLNDKVYGWIFAALSVGFIGASQLNSLLLQRYSSQQIVNVSLSAQALIGVAFLVLSASGCLELYGTVAVIFLFLCTIGITNPNTAALSLAPFSKNAGTASSLLGASQLGIGALVSMSVSFFDSISVTPLAGVICITSVIAFLVLVISLKVNNGRFITPDGEVPLTIH